MFGQITLEKIVKKTDEELSYAKENLGKAYIMLSKGSRSEDMELLIGEAYNTIDSWSQYYHKFNDILTNKIEELNKENIELIAENNRLKKEREQLESKVDTIVNQLDNVLKEIEANAKLIASSKGNREKQRNATGVNSNRYIQELDTEELIRVYRENNNSIPKEVKDVYHRKYGITYGGLRERLIKAGVWKGRT
jgi:SMC interacting uncharacterized protein involved in chromosome segregation